MITMTCVLFVQCTKLTQSQIDTIFEIDKPFGIKNDSLVNLISEISIFSLPPNLGELKRIHKLILDHDRIFILGGNEFRRLYVFSLSCDSSITIDHLGHGISNYVNIDDIEIDRIKKQILILDSDSQKINFYDYSGNYITTKALSFKTTNFCFCQDYYYFYTTKMPSPNLPNCEIIITDSLLNPVKQHLLYDEPNPVRFNTGPVFTKNFRDEVIFHRAFGDTIYKFIKTRIQPFAKIETIDGPPRRFFTDNKGFPIQFKNYIIQFGNPLSTKDYLSILILKRGRKMAILHNTAKHITIDPANFILSDRVKLGPPVGSDGNYFYFVRSGLMDINQTEDLLSLFSDSIINDFSSSLGTGGQLIKIKLN